MAFKVLGWAVFLSLVCGSASADPSCGQLNQIWQQKYRYDFKPLWPYNSFFCPSAESAIVQAMYELDTTSFFPSSSGFIPGFYFWVTHLMRGVAFQDGPAGNAVASTNRSTGITTFYKSFATQSLEWRTATLVHEARHIQADDPGHVTCDHGRMKGVPGACDQSLVNDQVGFGGGGSGYNYDFIYLWWVRDAANYTELDRSMANVEMKGLVLNSFNKVTPEQVQKWAN
jgi:hypothetical protein